MGQGKGDIRLVNWVMIYLIMPKPWWISVLLVLAVRLTYDLGLFYNAIAECFMPAVASSSSINQAAAGNGRIAVIGAGLAGLSAAWLLKQKYQVTLFESHGTPGMGVHTCDYHSRGLQTRIDVPLRIFTQGYYPELFALYRHIGVEMESSDHCAVYQYPADEKGISLKPFFQYRNKILFNKKFSFLHRNSLNAGGFSMLLAHYKFFRSAKTDFKQHRSGLEKISFGDYLKTKKFNEKYIARILLPALAVTCTCDYDGILEYPADLILEYLTCGVMDQGIVRAKLGVDSIVPKLTQGYSVRCHERIESVLDHQGGRPIQLTAKNLQDNHLTEHEFDYVILATQANVAQQILSAQADTEQSKLLSNIPMQSSTMVLHTDSSLVYDQQQASPVSYIVDKKLSRPSTSVDLSKAFSTYAQQSPVFQTWNIIKAPQPDTVINSSDFTRPLVTLNSRESVAQLLEINKSSRIKICGSYMANKIPLLDAAVESSVKLARQLGCDIPWDKAAQSADESYDAPALAY